ncbi:MAG: MinD/ParA family protein [Gemmatimonadota bacterium]|nr:hypothetical protein [Gemmatimonadota bacterium]
MNRQADLLRRFIGGPVPAPAAPTRGHLVAIGSGKGGTGASLLTALLALGTAAAGARTLLVDADLAFGIQHRLFGLGETPGLAALAGEADAEALCTPLTTDLDLLAGGGARSPISDLEYRTLLRRASACFGAYDLVLVDAGSRLETALRIIGAGAARLVVVATPEPIAAAAGYALIKAVHARHPGVPTDLVVNREDGPSARRTADEIAAAAKTWLGRRVSCLAALPEDAALRAALGAGFVLPDAAAGSPVADLLQTVAPTLLSLHAGAERPAVRSA